MNKSNHRYTEDMADRSGTYHHGDLRTALITAAREAIQAGNLHKLSLRLLAKEVGVVHSAAYRHFEDKAALIAAVYAEAYTDLLTLLQAVRSQRTPLDQLRETGRILSHYGFDNKELFIGLMGPRISEIRNFPDLEQAIQATLQITVQSIQQAQAEATLGPGDATEMAVYFWGALQGLIIQVLLGRIRLNPTARKEYVDKITDRIIKGMS